MARLAQIVVDCAHPSRLARFWATTLDGFEVRAYDEAEVSRLADLGLTPDTDPTVLVDGPRMELCFQQVELDEAAARLKNRVHLDVQADDLAAEVDRLIDLGATVRQRFSSHTWMLDPEGNDFCVVQAVPAG